MHKQRTLRAVNVLKFRCRLESADGKDVHRVFSGMYFPRWRGMCLAEVRDILGDIKLIEVFPFDVYLKGSSENFDYFYASDFACGSKIVFGPSRSQRDRSTKTFIVTEVDYTNLLTLTDSFFKKDNTKEYPSSVVENIIKMRDAFIHCAGNVPEIGIKNMGQRFRAVDDDGVRKVTKKKLMFALDDVRLSLSEKEIDEIFEAFPKFPDNSFALDDLMDVVRGPMGERRKQLIARVFQHIDKNGDGNITLHEIETHWNAFAHPDVQQGLLNEQQVIQGFMGVWETHDRNGTVSFAEFCDYYSGVSALITEDEEFERAVVSSWKL